MGKTWVNHFKFAKVFFPCHHFTLYGILTFMTIMKTDMATLNKHKHTLSLCPPFPNLHDHPVLEVGKATIALLAKIVARTVLRDFLVALGRGTGLIGKEMSGTQTLARTTVPKGPGFLLPGRACSPCEWMSPCPCRRNSPASPSGPNPFPWSEIVWRKLTRNLARGSVPKT